MEVIDTGLANTDAGPGFFNCQAQAGRWHFGIGNIEIHRKIFRLVQTRTSCRCRLQLCHSAYSLRNRYGNQQKQWRKNSPKYNSSARKRSAPTTRNCWKQPATLLVTASFLRSPLSPPTHGCPPYRWKDSRQKATLLNERLKRCQGNWEDAFFITLARNFGFGLNGDAFETWAHQLPFRAVDKHRNDLFQIEAIFFGQAGILEDSDGDGYYLRLKKRIHLSTAQIRTYPDEYFPMAFSPATSY